MRWLAPCFGHLLENRWKDVVVLQGAPVLGVLFGLDTLEGVPPVAIPVFAVASLLVVAHVFLLNDWSDAESDHHAREKRGRIFTDRGIEPRRMLLFCSVLGAAGLAMLPALSLWSFAFGSGVVLAGVAYSMPGIGTKGIPVASSVTHVAGQCLQFLMGYCLTRPPDLRGALVSIFFALVFAAGHLNQEVRDFEGDREAGTRTNAVVFGRRTAFFASHLLFAAAFAYLGWLAVRSLVPFEAVFLVGLYPVYALAFWRAFAEGLSYGGATRLQSVYRAIFVALGLGMIGIGVARLWSASAGAP